MLESVTLESIKCKNFRNLTPDIFNFSEKINLILGNNGNGKTNLLEAVYYLTNKKSFRKNARFQEMLSMDSDDPTIEIQALFNDYEVGEKTYSGKVNSDKGHWFCGNKKISSVPYKSIFINPFDSFLFHSSASFRRDWMDSKLGQIDSNFKKVLNRYKKSLKQRNFLLKSKPYEFHKQIKALDQNMVIDIQLIESRRAEFIQDLNLNISKTYKNIFSEGFLLRLDLKSDFSNKTSAEVLQVLDINFAKDRESGITNHGPHKDDYTLFIDDLDSINFGSLGQQKMAYLSLLFAYIEVFRYKLLVYPILLVDDVSGELDRERWERLVKYLEAKNFQVLITTANESFGSTLEKICSVKTIKISDGSIV